MNKPKSENKEEYKFDFNYKIPPPDLSILIDPPRVDLESFITKSLFPIKKVNKNKSN